MKTLIWLDDCRNPFDKRTDWLAYSPIGREVDVVWLKTVYEFMHYIDSYGLPDAICFDHDLEEDSYSELNGYDCAKYVVDYCINHGCDIPPIRFNPPTLSVKKTSDVYWRIIIDIL